MQEEAKTGETQLSAQIIDGMGRGCGLLSMDDCDTFVGSCLERMCIFDFWSAACVKKYPFSFGVRLVSRASCGGIYHPNTHHHQARNRMAKKSGTEKGVGFYYLMLIGGEKNGISEWNFKNADSDSDNFVLM